MTTHFWDSSDPIHILKKKIYYHKITVLTEIIQKTRAAAKMAFIQQIIQELCSPVILVAFLTLLFLFLIKQYERYRKLPPGPLGIPFIGQLNSIKKEFHLFLYDLCKNFGKITCFKMGVETIVVISDHKLIKKAFRSRDFTARPKSELTKLMGGYGKKIFVIYDYFIFLD